MTEHDREIARIMRGIDWPGEIVGGIALVAVLACLVCLMGCV